MLRILHKTICLLSMYNYASIYPTRPKKSRFESLHYTPAAKSIQSPGKTQKNSSRKPIMHYIQNAYPHHHTQAGASRGHSHHDEQKLCRRLRQHGCLLPGRPMSSWPFCRHTSPFTLPGVCTKTYLSTDLALEGGFCLGLGSEIECKGTRH